MTSLRSFAFNVLFYLSLFLIGTLALPVLLLPRGAAMGVVKFWSRLAVWLLAHVAGTRLEVRGREKIPAGPLLVASKHQSAFETFALLPLFDNPAFVMKRELTYLPLFGWFAAKVRMIPVDRGGRSAALKALATHARQAVAERRQIIIFPEGTRRPVGAPPDYKYGTVHLYADLDVPCLPVALNSGAYWRRRSWTRRPGTIVIEILDPIPPGLPKKEFLETLVERVEAASDRLAREAGILAPAIEDPAPAGAA